MLENYSALMLPNQQNSSNNMKMWSFFTQLMNDTDIDILKKKMVDKNQCSDFYRLWEEGDFELRINSPSKIL